MNLSRKVTPFFLSCLLVPVQGLGQRQAASISGIADLSNEQSPEIIDSATEKVRIHRETTGHWTYGGPDTTLFTHDRMLISSETRVRVEVRTQSHRGELVFLPDSLETAGREALFEILDDDIEELGLMSILLAKGSLIAHWAIGKLSIKANETRVLLSGTRVTVIAGQSGKEGILFIEEGRVSFPDYPEITTSERDIFQLRAGKPPVRITPIILAPERISAFAQFNGEEIWSTWFERNWGWIAGGAGAAVIAGVIILNGDEPAANVPQYVNVNVEVVIP